MSTEEKVTYNICQGAGCHEHCILKMIVEDDRIVRAERAPLKGLKADRYEICAKGIASRTFPDTPERLTHPLKRVGERGEGKFEKISWDQATKEIGEKLTEIREKYGPRSLVVNTFLSAMPANLNGSLTLALANRFVHLTDASKCDAEPVDVSSIWAGFIDFGSPFMTDEGNPLYWDRHRPGYLLLWGGNPVGWTRAGSMSRVIVEAQERGTKVVDISMLYDSTAAKADEFVRVNAGTDACLALSMVKVLIDEDLYDHRFVTDHTVSPYLVRNDNDQYLRKADVVDACEPDATGRDTSQDYVLWDSVANTYFFVERYERDWGEHVPDLNAQVEINGIPCKTVFVKLQEHVAKWTPEYQETITGVPAETVRHLVHDFMTYTPSGIFTYYGFRYRNGSISMRAIHLFSALTGQLDKLGGSMINGGTSDGYHVPVDFGIMVPNNDMSLVKGDRVFIDQIIDSIGRPDAQQYKAYINCFSNPLLNWPNRKTWMETIIPNFDLIVVNELRMTDTCMFADYVLPEASVYERPEILAPAGDCIVYCEPAVSPRGEARDSAGVWNCLAEAAGIGEYFNRTADEWFEMKLATPCPELVIDGEPLTLEKLKEERVIPMNVPDDIDNRLFSNMVFETPTGKIEFYREEFVDCDMAFADFVPTPLHDPERRKRHPYQFFPGRSRFFMQGQLTEIDELRELDGLQCTVGLNPATAKEKGIQSGDLVEVFNDHGASRAYAKLTEYVNPDMVLLWYAYPAKDYVSDPPTVLNHHMGTGDTQSAFSEAVQKLVRDDAAKTGLPPLLGSAVPAPNAAETFWDELVDFRKVEED